MSLYTPLLYHAFSSSVWTLQLLYRKGTLLNKVNWLHLLKKLKQHFIPSCTVSAVLWSVPAAGLWYLLPSSGDISHTIIFAFNKLLNTFDYLTLKIKPILLDLENLKWLICLCFLTGSWRSLSWDIYLNLNETQNKCTVLSTLLTLPPLLLSQSLPLKNSVNLSNAGFVNVKLNVKIFYFKKKVYKYNNTSVLLLQYVFDWTGKKSTVSWFLLFRRHFVCSVAKFLFCFCWMSCWAQAT